MYHRVWAACRRVWFVLSIWLTSDSLALFYTPSRAWTRTQEKFSILNLQWVLLRNKVLKCSKLVTTPYWKYHLHPSLSGLSPGAILCWFCFVLFYCYKSSQGHNSTGIVSCLSESWKLTSNILSLNFRLNNNHSLEFFFSLLFAQCF